MYQRAAIFGALALLAMVAVAAGTYSDHSGTAEKHSQRAQCGNIVKQKPSPPGSNRTYNCDLLDAMYSFSVNLTVSQQVVWEEFLEELQIKLSVNVSNMSPDQIIVFISFELQAFLEVNIDIEETISFLQVTDSTCGCNFGYLKDVISVSVMIQGEIVLPVITLDSDDDCPLFKSMRDACTTSEQEEWVAELELKLKVVLSVSAYSKEQKLDFCSEIIADFIAANGGKGSDCEKFLLSIEITAFGSFRSFVGVCKVEHQTVNVGVVISGSSASDCELIKCIDDAVNNGSNSISYGCKSQMAQLSSSLKIKFQANGDNQVRLQFCSVNIFQMLLQAPWCASDFLSIKIGVWGTMYDLEFCSNYCSEYGTCSCVNTGPGTPGTPGSGEATTVASSGATGATGSGEATTEASSGATGSGEATGSSAAASSAAPSSAAPSSVASSSAAPSSAAPSSAAPSSAAPSSAAPSSGAPSSVAPSSVAPSSGAPSSAAPSSSRPPTTAAPTTPSGPNCGSRISLVVIGQGATGPCSGNCTALTDACTTALNNLPSYQKGSFSGIVASVKAICFDATLTVQQKVTQSVAKLNGCPSTIKTQVFATIVFHLNISWGSIGDFCGCGNA